MVSCIFMSRLVNCSLHSWEFDMGWEFLEIKKGVVVYVM